MAPKKKSKTKGSEWTITMHNNFGEFGNAPIFSSTDELGLPMQYYFVEEFQFEEYVKFFVGQLELTQSGGLHLQAYVEFMSESELPETKQRLRHMLGVEGSTKAHLEVAVGDRPSNIVYCGKKKSSVEDSIRPKKKWERPGTHDETVGKGRRFDMAGIEMQMYKMLEEYLSVPRTIDVCLTMMKAADKDKDEYERERVLKLLKGVRSGALQHEAFIRFRIESAKRKREMEVVEKRSIQVRVLYGPPGTGKTRKAMIEYQSMGVYQMQSYSRFWHYKGELAILIDDWKGEWVGGGPSAPYLTPSVLQQLCEGWPMFGDVKHSPEPVEISHVVLIFTTNLKFNAWYNGWNGIPPETIRSIESRIPNSCWELIDGEDHRPAVHCRYEIRPLPVCDVNLDDLKRKRQTL